MSDTAQITGCSATKEGGGVWLNEQKIMTMSGGSITGNHAGIAGGGIYINPNNINKKSTKLILSGRVTVSGNTAGTDEYDCNVQLGTADEPAFTNNSIAWDNWNGVIVSNGLSRNSNIGIYVPGEDGHPNEKVPENKTTHYEVHGKVGCPFGTIGNDSNTDYLYCFVNDRNGLKGGMQPGDKVYIHWV